MKISFHLLFLGNNSNYGLECNKLWKDRKLSFIHNPRWISDVSSEFSAIFSSMVWESVVITQIHKQITYEWTLKSNAAGHNITHTANKYIEISLIENKESNKVVQIIQREEVLAIMQQTFNIITKHGFTHQATYHILRKHNCLPEKKQSKD